MDEGRDVCVVRCAQVEEGGKASKAPKAKYLVKCYALPVLSPLVTYRCTLRDENEHPVPLGEYASSDAASERPVIMVHLPSGAAWTAKPADAVKKMRDQMWATVGPACTARDKKKGDLLMMEAGRWEVHPGVKADAAPVAHLIDGLHMNGDAWERTYWPAWRVWGRSMLLSCQPGELTKMLERLKRTPEEFLLRTDQWALNMERMDAGTFAWIGPPGTQAESDTMRVWTEASHAYRTIALGCTLGDGRVELPRRE